MASNQIFNRRIRYNSTLEGCLVALHYQEQILMKQYNFDTQTESYRKGKVPHALYKQQEFTSPFGKKQSPLL